MIDPTEDGVTHINVYSKGQTDLGKLLSNFAHTPFELDGLMFASVEAWWYWQGWDEDDSRLRSMYGWMAKQYGKNLPPCEPPTKAALKRVYLRKLQAHKGIFKLLIQNVLPLEHYYVYFTKDGRAEVVGNKWLWTAKLWEEIKLDFLDHLEEK